MMFTSEQSDLCFTALVQGKVVWELFLIIKLDHNMAPAGTVNSLRSKDMLRAVSSNVVSATAVFIVYFCISSNDAVNLACITGGSTHFGGQYIQFSILILTKPEHEFFKPFVFTGND
jgi:hypothetical protein